MLISIINFVKCKQEILKKIFSKRPKLDKFDALYFCEHTFSRFDNYFYFVRKKPTEFVVRTFDEEILFVCKDCHLDVVKTFDSYWLILGDFPNYFMRCF